MMTLSPCVIFYFCSKPSGVICLSVKSSEKFRSMDCDLFERLPFVTRRRVEKT